VCSSDLAAPALVFLSTAQMCFYLIAQMPVK
jgi:hypothetical protein